MSISRSLRFKVLRRDDFTCVYCGRQAPEVVLEVDHIFPVSRGGDDHILNLVTSCYDCNHGKRERLMDPEYTDYLRASLFLRYVEVTPLSNAAYYALVIRLRAYDVLDRCRGLNGFSLSNTERLIRWAREKAGLSPSTIGCITNDHGHNWPEWVQEMQAAGILGDYTPVNEEYFNG